MFLRLGSVQRSKKHLVLPIKKFRRIRQTTIFPSCALLLVKLFAKKALKISLSVGKEKSVIPQIPMCTSLAAPLFMSSLTIKGVSTPARGALGFLRCLI